MSNFNLNKLEAERRKQVQVGNPKITIKGDRHKAYRKALSNLPESLRSFVRLIKSEDRYPAYQEGHVAKLDGESWVIQLRLWNTAAEQVLYYLVRADDKKESILHEDTVIVSDSIHGDHTDTFYQLRHEEKSL